jgi:hypothetical protein
MIASIPLLCFADPNCKVSVLMSDELFKALGRGFLLLAIVPGNIFKA